MAVIVPVALFVVFCSVVLLYKKDELRRDYTAYLESRIQRSLGLRVHVRGFDGNLFGKIAFLGVVVRSDREPGDAPLFKAEEISVHYRLWDLFAGSLNSAVRVEMDRPIFYADVPFLPDGGVRSKSLEIFSKILLRLRDRTRIVIKNGTIAWTNREGMLSGISGSIENSRFDLRVRLDHMKIAYADVSTELVLRGQLEGSGDGQSLVGDLRTQGTVVNWKPFEHESQIGFALTPEHFVVKKESEIGGFRVDGSIGIAEKEDIDLNLKAVDYSLTSIGGLFSMPARSKLIGVAVVDLKLTGSVSQPMVKGELLLKDSEIGGRPFKNMQLFFTGVYPELQVSQSRVVLHDGTTMNFANQRINARDLFDDKTYTALVTRQDQDDVSWGDWKLTRKDRDDSVVVERDLGDALKIKYEKYGRDEAHIDPSRKKDEVELEYLLSGSDSFMMQLNEDDEKFVGLQKKVSF